MDKQDYAKLIETAKLALAINSGYAIANMYMPIGLMKSGRETKAYQEKALQLSKKQVTNQGLRNN